MCRRSCYLCGRDLCVSEFDIRFLLCRFSKACVTCARFVFFDAEHGKRKVGGKVARGKRC